MPKGRRYVEGRVEETPDGLQWRVIVADNDGTRAWACTDGCFYPLGTGPELPPDERRPYALPLHALLHDAPTDV